MDIGKLAMALAALVIIGLIIFAVIKFVLPGAFEYVGCAMKTFLDPKGASGGLSTCATELQGKIKFGD